MLIEAFKSKSIDVPIMLYETFVIEDKYGFNKKTIYLFFYDLVIECLLTIIIVPVVLYGYLYVVEIGGDYFFLYVSAIQILLE